MPKTYDIPMSLSVALNTDRIEFLAGLTPEQLAQEDARQVLRDLIEDRVKLRREIAKCVDALRDAERQVSAAQMKWRNLEVLLNGTVDDGKCVHDNHPDRCEMCATGMDQGGVDARGNSIE